ncbi:MAG: hypothetical protein RIS70_2877 [Planctomycetota bacterium]
MSWFSRTFNEATSEAIDATGLAHALTMGDRLEAPLFVLVHGRAGNRHSMSMFRQVLPAGVNVLAPEAFLDDPADGGRSWWFSGDRSPESHDAARERFEQFLDRAVGFYGLRPASVVGVGFSQGAALLSLIVQEQPWRLHRAALLAGFVIERSVEKAGQRPDVFIAHGTVDPIVPIERARRGAEWLRQCDCDVTVVEDPVGHKIGREGMRQLKGWLQATRDPHPDESG